MGERKGLQLGTLDFSKLLPSTPPGETFQGLVRLMGQRLRMVVEWSGRGADGGRDLIFVETQSGPINARSVRWLVSCKDNSESKRSVTERDVGSVSDKVKQHKCDGFLLATTTTASTGLKEMLDTLDIAAGGTIQTKVWDCFEITQMLLSSEFTDLLLQFFPDHQRREAVSKLDAAREIVEAALPRFLAGRVRERLVPFKERYSLLSGSTVWPHDAEQQALIDTLKLSVAHRLRVHVAEETIEKLHFDAFMAFSNCLIRNYTSRAITFLKAVAETSSDDRVIYNAIEMLRESGEFSLNEELKITCRCDTDTLFDLYYEKASNILSDPHLWKGGLGFLAEGRFALAEELRQKVFRPHDDVSDVDIVELNLSGGSRVSVSARVSMNVLDDSGDPDEPPSEKSVSYNVEAHFDGSGLIIDSIE